MGAIARPRSPVGAGANNEECVSYSRLSTSKKVIMAERRSSHRTQWAAQFSVASELCKRDYEVAFTTGNHPSVDLMARSPGQISFGIDVKGLYKRNFWAVRAKTIKPNLFYVFAFVPDEGPNRYFVLNQLQVNTEIEADIERAKRRALSKGRSDEKAGTVPGISWKFAEEHEGNWDALPA